MTSYACEKCGKAKELGNKGKGYQYICKACQTK